MTGWLKDDVKKRPIVRRKAKTFFMIARRSTFASRSRTGEPFAVSYDAEVMKPAETKTTEDADRADQDLPELGVRILSDFGRIVAAEARLLEINIVGAARALVDRIYLAALLIVIAAAGVVSIIGGICLLLHEWMPWWQVLGIVGLASMLLAEILRRTLMHPEVPIVEISTPRGN